jgi:hypothetical protein
LWRAQDLKLNAVIEGDDLPGLHFDYVSVLLIDGPQPLTVDRAVVIQRPMHDCLNLVPTQRLHQARCVI